MKRFISIILILVTVTLFTVPASASDFDNVNSINLLDYATINDSGSNFYSFSSGKYFSVSMPSKMSVKGLDFIVRSNSSDIRFQVETGGYWFVFERLSLGDNLYRFYNYDLPGYDESVIDLWFNYDTGTYFQLYRLDMYSQGFTFFNDSGSIILRSYLYDDMSIKESYSASMPNSTSGCSVELPCTYGNDKMYELYLSCSNWRKYDYLDFFVCILSASIDSVDCYFGGLSVPYEISYMNETNLVDNFIGDGDIRDPWAHLGHRYINVRLDLRGLDRSSSNTNPYLLISGSSAAGDSSLFSLYTVKGFVQLDEPNPLFTYFTRLTNSIGSGFTNLINSISSNFSALTNSISNEFSSLKSHLTTKFKEVTDRLDTLISGDSSQSNGFNESVDSQVSEMDGMNDTLDSVTKPAVDDMNVSMDGYVSPNDISGVGALFAIFLSDGIIFSIFMISLLLTLVSFVFYGKR